MRRLPGVIHTILNGRAFHPLVLAGCLAPGFILLYNALPVLLPLAFPDVQLPWTGNLGVDPSKAMLHATGRDALALLLITLTVTPVRRLTGWNRVQTVRRTLGLSAFFYALAHLLVYVVFDQLADIGSILNDVFTRQFIFVGMFAFTILLALALTSTNAMIRRLKRRWQTLHRLAYVAAIAGVVHFAWGQKADIHEPLEWGAYLAVLLGVRVFYTVRKRRARVAADSKSLSRLAL